MPKYAYALIYIHLIRGCEKAMSLELFTQQNFSCFQIARSDQIALIRNLVQILRRQIFISISLALVYRLHSMTIRSVKSATMKMSGEHKLVAICCR